MSEIDDERGFNDGNFWIYNVFLSWSKSLWCSIIHDDLYMSDQMGGKLHSKLHQKNMTSKTFFLIIEFENISWVLTSKKILAFFFQQLEKKAIRYFSQVFFSYCIEIIGNGFLYQDKSTSYIPK